MSQPPPRPQTEFNPERFDLLLQACFLKDPNAIAAFERWNTYNNWDDHFNIDEYRLFQQLYRNLSALGFDHPLMAKFRGIARKAWYNNNLFFHRFAPTLKELQDAGIPVLVLGGGAFALRYYTDYILAHTIGFGILVHPEHVRATLDRLAREGWQPQPKVDAKVLDAYLSARYYHVLYHPNGERIYLQWQVLPSCPRDNSDAPFWKRAVEVTLDNASTLVLEPTDQLLRTCALGTVPGGSPRAQRSSDAMLLLNAAADQINWYAFLERIQALHVVFPVREILVPLAARFKTPIPAPILDKLTALPLSPDEDKDRTLWDAVTPTERVNQLWRTYVRRSCNQGVAGFPRFLQHWWGLETLAQVPTRALSAFRWQRFVRK